MTKNIRIENADNSKYKVVVEVWDTVMGDIPVLIETKTLANPTDMLNIAIWGGRHLLVREE